MTSNIKPICGNPNPFGGDGLCHRHKGHAGAHRYVSRAESLERMRAALDAQLDGPPQHPNARCVVPAPVVCLVCGAMTAGTTFWDHSEVPLCRLHLNTLRPVLTKWASKPETGGGMSVSKIADTPKAPSHDEHRHAFNVAATCEICGTAAEDCTDEELAMTTTKDGTLTTMQETLRKALNDEWVARQRAEYGEKARVEFDREMAKLRALAASCATKDDVKKLRRELGLIISKMRESAKFQASEFDPQAFANTFWATDGKAAAALALSFKGAK